MINTVIIIIIILLIVLLNYKLIKKDKKILVILITIIGVYFIYSLFTYSGSVRFKILTMGHPIKAYQTKLEEVRHQENYKYFYPTGDIETTSGHIGYIRCQNYLIKICEYYGFG